MILLNDPEDPPIYFSRRWVSSTTPDLAFATDDLSKKTTRGVQNQLGGSDHRPVKLAINLQYRPQDSKTFPRWNYKKANWDTFVSLSDQYTKGIRVADQKHQPCIDAFNKAIFKAASETIPRGARKNYSHIDRKLQELEDEVSQDQGKPHHRKQHSTERIKRQIQKSLQRSCKKELERKDRGTEQRRKQVMEAGKGDE
ncbi:hypothetical protein C0Q70_12161 [Pomacea canaliculata]|uniref:Endonuclease/exonuclease/phosphatase domain-containing protein n=1 Tax=Pomacea canaliculata TaxID=400727 RepID=A0A2T7P0R5_POMCA|nr:hypothetical protein C0Q70_12161 [Pomacea canaliculata]